MHIVFIDDEEVTHDSINLCLFSTEYKLKSFFNPQEALNYLLNTEDKIDIILLDLMMHGFHGIEVLNMIKKIPKIKNVPVVIQTSINKPEDIAKCMHLGADYYLQKPYNKEDLIKVFENVKNTRSSSS
ncbi:MAG: response regulator [Sphingobacteriia bacterium]|nr:response regulator [Sphingobacteriia bacterium]